jgi:DNA-directed RNA polymerase subunit K/omega
MNDFDRATRNAGNRFDLVLIASERMRELHDKRRKQEQEGELSLKERKSQPIPAHQAVRDVEEGLVGREYLGRVRDRGQNRRRPRFDDLK